MWVSCFLWSPQCPGGGIVANLFSRSIESLSTPAMSLTFPHRTHSKPIQLFSLELCLLKLDRFLAEKPSWETATTVFVFFPQSALRRPCSQPVRNPRAFPLPPEVWWTSWARTFPAIFLKKSPAWLASSGGACAFIQVETPWMFQIHWCSFVVLHPFVASTVSVESNTTMTRGTRLLLFFQPWPLDPSLQCEEFGSQSTWSSIVHQFLTTELHSWWTTSQWKTVHFYDKSSCSQQWTSAVHNLHHSLWENCNQWRRQVLDSVSR